MGLGLISMGKAYDFVSETKNWSTNNRQTYCQAFSRRLKADNRRVVTKKIFIVLGIECRIGMSVKPMDCCLVVVRVMSLLAIQCLSGCLSLSLQLLYAIPFSMFGSDCNDC